MLKFKQSLISILGQYFTDRHLGSLYIVLLVLSIIDTIYILFNLIPNELQLVSRYSFFGDTNFYRDQWYFLIYFIVFSWLVTISSILISKKIHDLIGRSLALLFAWMGVSLVVFSFMTSSSILNIWSPT